MNIGIVILDFALAIILYLVMNYLKEKFSQKVLFVDIVTPVLFLFFITVFYDIFYLHFLTNNLYLITIFYSGIYFLVENYLYDKKELFSIKNYLLISILQIFLSIILYNNFIGKLDSILLTAEELRLPLWILFIFILYLFLKDKVVIKPMVSSRRDNALNQEYIIVSYAKKRAKYDSVVNGLTKNKQLRYLMYAIMIYNDKIVPQFIRKLHLKFVFLNKRKRYGIMQVENRVALSDEESIQVAFKQLERIVEKQASKKAKNITDILMSYYNDSVFVENTQIIYDMIVKFDTL